MVSSNEEFIKKAFEAGLTEDQVRSAVAERNQRKSSATPNKPSFNFQDGLQSIANLLGLGTSAKNLKLAVMSPSIGKEAETADQLTNQSVLASKDLIERAKQETDPLKKQLLLDESRKITNSLGDSATDFDTRIGEVIKQGGVTEKDLKEGTNLGFATKRGTGTAAEAAAWLLPAVKGVQEARIAAQGAGAGSRLLNAGLMGGAQGSLQGVAEAAVSAENPLDAVQKIVTGGGVGAATSGVLQGLSEAKNLVTGVAGKLGNTAKKAYAGTLKQNIADQKFYKQAGGVDKVVSDAIRLDIPNTKEGVRQELMNYGEEFSKTVDTELAKSKVGGKTADLTSIYTKAKEDVLKQFKDPESRGLLKQAESYFKEADKVYLNENNKNVSLDSINRLRKRLDSRVGELLQDEISNGETKAIKSFATGLREQFRKELPQLKDTFRKYQLLSGLAEAMQKEPAFGITNLLGGAIVGSSGVLPGVAATAATTAIRSPGLKRKVLGDIIRKSAKIGTSAPSMTPELLQSVASILSSRAAVSPQ